MIKSSLSVTSPHLHTHLCMCLSIPSTQTVTMVTVFLAFIQMQRRISGCVGAHDVGFVISCIVHVHMKIHLYVSQKEACQIILTSFQPGVGMLLCSGRCVEKPFNLLQNGDVPAFPQAANLFTELSCVLKACFSTLALLLKSFEEDFINIVCA